MNSKVNELIKNFHPGWYASVMGTGGLANAMYLFSGKFSFFKGIAEILVALNIFLFIIFIFPWLARWIWHFERLLEDLKHPMLGNFFATMPVGMLILGANIYLIGPDMFSFELINVISLIFYVIGSVLILFFTLVVMHNAYVRENLSADHINFAWFITPVANIVVPVLGCPLARYYLGFNPNIAKIIILSDIIFYGIGFMLFIFIGAVVFARFINHKLPHPQVSPTFWIILGPIGIGVVSIFGIVNSLNGIDLIEDPNTLKALGTIFWGFGFWAFLQTAILTIKYFKEGIPFGITWWAYIFPFAAYTISTKMVNDFLKSEIIYWYGIGLLSLLTFMWLVVFVKSILSIEKLFFPKKS